jgi:hypothetical protein
VPAHDQGAGVDAEGYVACVILKDFSSRQFTDYNDQAPVDWRPESSPRWRWLGPRAEVRRPARAGPQDGLARRPVQTKMDLQGKRQQISSLMLRLGRIYPGKKTWGPAHVNWLMAQKLEHREQRIAFEELLEGMRQEEERVQRLEEAIRDAVPEWSLAEVATALRAVRGIDLIAAVAVLAELGDLSRFRNPRELMGYLGLVPSESSTGDAVKRGGITKAGNGGETHPCGSGVELSISAARESRETAKGGGCAQTRARDCLESASQTVRALPVARAEGQAANRNRHGDCP